MNAQDIRRTFLDFFARKGHKVLPSSPLLPKDDPTLLFTNAGMNQFKNIFLGLETRSYKRAATVQKCMRVSGKHNDLEQVGRTRKHHTFFEMLGNFSFGDYFKREAILSAWELMTGVFAFPKDRLYVTVYEEDDEAFALWNTEAGVPADRIFRLGKKDNFWAMGETGPCGPCSEIHYDQDPALEPGTPLELIESGSDRMVELWNLVFMQFYQDEKGVLHPLPSPSIDTGMGLERMAAALQHKTSNFETDLFRPLIGAICGLAGREYPAGDEGDVYVRVIADHVRAVSFMIGDGIMPANDGRGYVLRRLVRRAFRKGNLIGLDEPFVYKLVGTVGDIMKDAYPELLTSQNFISKICHAEEERFARTLASGLRYFRQYAGEARERGGTALSGDAAFKLYDTFGVPLDLSHELAQEERLTIDETGFHDELTKQKARARLSWKGAGPHKERKVFEGLAAGTARFSGVDCGRVDEAVIVALIKDGARVPALAEGESGEVVLDVTPFYAEAGGQVGDAGHLKNARASAAVETAYYPVPDVRSHKIKILSGMLREGDAVAASIDEARRKAVRGNHTATHLLHAALRQTLGDHVKQAGSLVSPARLRFDFTHFQAMEPGELAQVERLVNEKIREDLRVSIKETTLEEGVREGAMAIFEEKYGEMVRMVSVGDFSRELCGGAHAPATGEIGLFKIVSETSVAAGMRRIEAVTGEEALAHVQETEALLDDLLRSLGASRRDAPAQVEKLKEHIREKDREIKAIRQKLLQGGAEGSGEEVRTVRGVKVLVQKRDGLIPSEARGLADALKGKIGSGVVILGAVADGKAFLVVGVTKDLAGRISAADMIKGLAPIVGGGGGGRPDFAQAGGTKTEALDAALEAGPGLVESLLR
jgi:alanyl-tRNA synthetase